MNEETTPFVDAEGRHWLCGKVDCDCDEQYEAWKDEEMRREEEQDYERY